MSASANPSSVPLPPLGQAKHAEGALPVSGPSFASLLRILGRGATLSRSLTLEEAEAAMTMICTGQAEPIQVGAFLLLLRYRGESPEELAGMVRALRTNLVQPTNLVQAAPLPVVDLDWPSYAAGRTRGLPWFVLSALLVAEQGRRVFMHGYHGEEPQQATPEQALHALGVPLAADGAEAANHLERHGFAYLPLHRLCPKLHALIGLRRLLGLRSVANTMARMLNPWSAPALIQGVFHPPYRPLQQQAASLLGQPHLAVFKGGGGEAERAAGKECEVYGIAGETQTVTLWPGRSPAPERPVATNPATKPDLGRLAALWRGDLEDDHARAVVLGTAAIAFSLTERISAIGQAEALAEQAWQKRDRARFPRRRVALCQAE